MIYFIGTFIFNSTF